MKTIVLWAGVVAMLASFGCTVETGGPVGGGAACEALACGDALVNGLAQQGDVLCSAPADSAYAAIQGCACGDSSGPGECTDVCSDNLCADLGETSDCGDCLNQLCGPEHDTCANN